MAVTSTIAAAQRTAIVVHRWLGVGLCAVFFTWFTSGIVLVYHSFPEVTPRDRLAHAAPLDAMRVRVSAESAYKALHESTAPWHAVLESIDGRPAWRFNDRLAERVVYADDGVPRPVVTDAMIRAAAQQWAGAHTAVSRVSAVAVADQWTLEGELRSMRPLWKVEFNDGQQVYVNGRNAEVVQATTSTSRAWSWAGPIPHFLYFAFIRRHRDAWRDGVMALSALATLSALLGLFIGVTKFSPRARFRRNGNPARIPYTGAKGLHQVFGLVIGISAVTWAFSGLLSLDPFPVYVRPVAAPSALDDAARALRVDATDLAPYASLAMSEVVLAAGAGVVRIEPSIVAGEPMFVATLADGRERFVPLVRAVSDSVGAQRTVAVMRAAAGSVPLEIRAIGEYDTYYHDREHALPLPVLLVTNAREPGARLYVDPRTATYAGGYRPSQWVERWLYHGLHSLDLPWLYQHRPLWDIVVISLLAGGVLLSGTSLILAWRVLRRWTNRRRTA